MSVVPFPTKEARARRAAAQDRTLAGMSHGAAAHELLERRVRAGVVEWTLGGLTIHFAPDELRELAADCLEDAADAEELARREAHRG